MAEVRRATRGICVHTCSASVDASHRGHVAVVFLRQTCGLLRHSLCLPESMGAPSVGGGRDSRKRCVARRVGGTQGV